MVFSDIDPLTALLRILCLVYLADGACVVIYGGWGVIS